MAKLGYTWYPKDWGNSEKVFELTLVERGLYRELIDMAMLNDNKTTINIKVWSRKFGSSISEIQGILITLTELNLIEIDNNNLFISSCEPRLNLIRGGRKGGKKSKPIKSLSEALPEALPEAYIEPKESKVKESKVKESKIKEDKKQSFKEKKESFIKWFNDSKLKYKGIKGRSKVLTQQDENNLKKLLETYPFAEFDIALKNLYKSKWASENGMQTISHFLRVENFNKYLEQGDTNLNYDPNANPVN